MNISLPQPQLPRIIGVLHLQFLSLGLCSLNWQKNLIGQVLPVFPKREGPGKEDRKGTARLILLSVILIYIWRVAGCATCTKRIVEHLPLKLWKCWFTYCGATHATGTPCEQTKGFLFLQLVHVISFLGGPLLNIKIILRSKSSISISLIVKYKEMLGL